MNDFLQKLIDSDSKINIYSTSQQIIEQGLAPLKALDNDSYTIQKAKLLESAKFQNWQEKAKQLFDQLYANNISFLVFKGFSYSYLLYNNTSIRPYSDIDILIQHEDYQVVSTILNVLCYQCFPSRQGKYISFQNTFFDQSPLKTLFDIHWQISNRVEFHQYFRFNDLYDSAQVIKTQEIHFKTLSNDMAFIHGCFHLLAHRPEDRKHIWLYDLAILWHNMTAEQQKNCLQLAKITQQLGVINKVLILLAETFGAIIKYDVNLVQEDHEVTSAYVQQRKRKITDIKTRIRNINGFSNKLKFLSEYLFQDAQYMQNRYHLNSSRWVVFYYPKMWLEDIIKLFK
jgi:hypothetical protein